MRNRGPRAKVMRRFGVALAPSPKDQRILEKRPTGTNLLQLLETRLDAVVYRLPGVATSQSRKVSKRCCHTLCDFETLRLCAYRGGIVPPPYLELDRDLIVEFYSR